jgi:hypothetical protein
MGEHRQALLGPRIQRDRLVGIHADERDKVAVPLAVTKSLSLDSRALAHGQGD